MAVLPFADVVPTFIENWPPAWTARAPQSVSVVLDPAEMRALGAMQSVWGEPFGRCDRAALARVSDKINALFQQMPGDAAIRLGARSPKDADLAIAAGMRVSSPERAFALMIDGSERLARDLSQALLHDYAMSVFLRRWVEGPPWGEIRVFIWQRQIVGAFAPEGVVLPVAQSAGIVAGIAEVGGKLARDAVLDSFVADLIFPAGKPPMLLDVNPYHPLSGAGPFTWDRTVDRGGDFDGTFRFGDETGAQRRDFGNGP